MGRAMRTTNPKSMPFLVLALLLASTSLARAQDRAADLAPPTAAQPTGRPGFALDISASTMLPLVVGGTVGFEVPGHVVFRVGAGIVPSAYVDAINAVGTGAGAYDDGAGQLLSLLLDDATFLEVGLGWRPFGTPGIELAVSYAMLWSHRRIDMSQLGGLGHDAGLDLTIDAVHAELAWQTEPVDHVYFRIALGWAQAFDHHVAIAGQGDEAQQAAFHATADALAATVGQYAFGPTLDASLGVRF
jgi:hypothetical protein